MPEGSGRFRRRCGIDARFFDRHPGWRLRRQPRGRSHGRGFVDSSGKKMQLMTISLSASDARRCSPGSASSHRSARRSHRSTGSSVGSRNGAAAVPGGWRKRGHVQPKLSRSRFRFNQVEKAMNALRPRRGTRTPRDAARARGRGCRAGGALDRDRERTGRDSAPVTTPGDSPPGDSPPVTHQNLGLTDAGDSTSSARLPPRVDVPVASSTFEGSAAAR